MLEAFKVHPSILVTPRLSTSFIYRNLLFPLLNLAFTLFFIPGIVLACFGIYWIVGPMTLALLPLAVIVNYLMFLTGRSMFDELGMRVRRTPKGFCCMRWSTTLFCSPLAVSAICRSCSS